MKISDFKNEKILTEFGCWQCPLYDDSELRLMFREHCISTLKANKIEDIEATLKLNLEEDDEDFILNILDSLCKGSNEQKALAKVLTYTTLRLAEHSPRSEWCVDKLGFYCYESERYEVCYIGLLLKEIINFVMDLALKHREMITDDPLYVYVTDEPDEEEEPLPDFILNADLATIRKWLIAIALIHGMAHAYLDRIGKSHGNALEEPMANLITLSVAEHSGDNDYFEFVKWFIYRQDPKYSFAIALYNEAKSQGLTPAQIMKCADLWAIRIANDDKAIKNLDKRQVIYDGKSKERDALAKSIIDEIIHISGNTMTSCASLDLPIRVWHIFVKICQENNIGLKDFLPSDPLSGKVVKISGGKQQVETRRLITMIYNYLDFLCSPKANDWKEWKKSWNGFSQPIYKHLPKTMDELDELLSSMEQDIKG